jgi:predicted phage terminase large subunit-like protein
MRAASNPGGVGHAFVKQRFLEGQPTANRVFIPSRLDDNPHLDQEQYRTSLQELDPFTRAQLLEGDWSEHSDGCFRREWFPIIDFAPADFVAITHPGQDMQPQAIERKVRAWDLAATAPTPGRDPDWTVGLLMGKTQQGEYIIIDVQRIRATPLAVQELVLRCAAHDGRGVRIVMEEEGGSSGKFVTDQYARALAGWQFQGIRSTGNKRERAAPLSRMAQAGHVKLVRGPWNAPFLDELATFPQGAHDDQVDAASLAFSQLTRKREFWIRQGGWIG